MYLVLVQVRLLIRRFIRLRNKGYAWISNSDWKSHPVTTSGYDFQLPLWIKFYCQQKSTLNFELKLQYFNFLSENLYNYSCMCTPPLSSKELPFQNKQFADIKAELFSENIFFEKTYHNNSYFEHFFLQ